MKRLLSLLLFLMPLWLMAAPPPPYRPNFFDTNVNPRVIVAAGTNVTVQYTTTGTDTRTYTVNSAGGGIGTGQTNQVYTQIGWSGNPTITNLTSQTIYSTGIVQRFEAGSTNTLVVTNGGIGVNTDTPIIGSITINRPSNGTGLSITNANTSGVILSRYNSAAPPGFALQKYGATLSPTSPVANSELLGRYQANAADGSQIQVAGHYTFVTASTNAGAITSSNLPAELVIYLNPGGGTNNVLERARFTYDGRLGIGTATPSDTLTVIGGITASNTMTATNGFVDGSGTVGSLVAYGPGNRLIATNANYLTNGYPWTNIYSPGISGGSTNQVYTQTGWSGYPQVTNLSLITNGLGTSIVPTLWLTNPTPAALGAQQNSPALMLGGQGWRSGNSTTMPVQAGILCEPVQGSSANPLAQLYFIASVAGAAPVIMGWMKSDYTLTMQGGISAGGNIGTSSGTVSCEGASAFTVGTRSRIYSPADQDLRLTDSTGLLFNRLYFGAANALWPALKVESTNAPTLSIRTGADANYASLIASNVTATVTVFANSLTSTNGGTVGGAVLSTSSTTNSPAANELATAGWTRSLFAGAGVSYYATTNVANSFTNSDYVGGTNFEFSTTIPPYGRRLYVDPAVNSYVGSVVVTNKLLQIDASIVVNAYLDCVAGTGSGSLQVHPEIYVSYDGTNWIGDWIAASQTITPGVTNLYQWVVSNPAYVTTNATGFYVERRFKITAQTSNNNADLGFNLGTNFPSHISLPGQNTSAGMAYLAANQTFTGTNTFTIGNRSFLHDSSQTLITNTVTLTGTSFGDGVEKHWWNGTATVQLSKTNGTIQANGLIFTTNANDGIVLDATKTYQFFSTNASFTVSGFSGLVSGAHHVFSITYSNSGASAIVATAPAYVHYPTNGVSTNVLTIPAYQEAIWSWWIRPNIRTNMANILIP